MEDLLSLFGVLFAGFLVLAASVEVVLEAFRGTLSSFGFDWPKGKVSVEESLRLAKEFAPSNKELHTKLKAVQSAARQVEGKVSHEITSLRQIERNLSNALDDRSQAVVAGELNEVAAKVKAELDRVEDSRVVILKAVAALIGFVLVGLSHFYVLEMIAGSPTLQGMSSQSLETLRNPFLNTVIGGLAAAAGSNYWHDQLDRVRSLKNVSAEMRKLAS